MSTDVIINKKNPPTTNLLKNKFSSDILHGLTQLKKFIPSKYFIDERGFDLYYKISELNESYIARTERDILLNNRVEIIEILGDDPFNLIELGPGDCHKTQILMKECFVRHINYNYIPVDISLHCLKEVEKYLLKPFPKLTIYCLLADYFKGLPLDELPDQRRNICLFLGSMIGELSKLDGIKLMTQIKENLKKSDYFIIGFDLKKDIQQLLNAYNDSLGLFAQYNLNILRRINQSFSGNFDLNGFRHYATYNVHTSAVECYLVSTKQQVVQLADLNTELKFEKWEPVLTQINQKYSVDDIEEMAEKSGYAIKKHFFDSKNLYVNSIWEV
jgi:dimethylhistidine N-methyltransferase